MNILIYPLCASDQLFYGKPIMTSARPTLRSLAAEAGVSAMTVSLALRNSHKITAATRQRIQRLAAARDYRPDPAITRLMQHLRQRAPARSPTNIIGLMQSWPPYQRSYLGRLCCGLEARAASLGFAFTTLNLDDNRSGAQLQRLLLSRGVEGLVILPLRRLTNLSQLLNWSAFSTVSITSAVIAPQFHSVMPNHYDNMIAVCRALTHVGCRRIGLAITSDWNVRLRHRWAGAIMWQNCFGGTQAVSPLITQEAGQDLDAGAFTDWLKREKPDAVVTDSVNQATITAGLAHLARRQRPKMITMNWPDSTSDAGLDQRPDQLGSAAIDVLAGLLTRGEKGIPANPGSIMIDGRWVNGKLNSSR